MVWAGYDFQKEIDSFLALPDVAEERRRIAEADSTRVCPGQIVFKPYLQPVPKDGELKYRSRADTVGVVVKVVEGEGGEEPLVTVMTNLTPSEATGPHWELPAEKVESDVVKIEDLCKELNKKQHREIKHFFLTGHLSKENMVEGRVGAERLGAVAS